MDISPVAAPGAQHWRFSLKHLFIVLGMASLVLAPAHYFGGIYLTSIGLSLAFVFTCAIAYRTTAVGAVAAAIAGLVFGFFLAMVLLTFGIHAFFNFLACIVLVAAGVRPRNFAIGLGLTMFAVYSFSIYSGITEMRKLTALKASIPFEPLTERLAFEDESPAAKRTLDQPIQLAVAVAAKLDEQDERLDKRHFGREWALRELHEHAAAQFVRAAGFGLMRMPYVSADIVRLDPRTPIKLPVPVAITPFHPANAVLEFLHQSAVYNFVDPTRMGYARSRSEVAGFESHGLSSLERNEYNAPANPDWLVTRLELVSLLRHAEPRVYVAASLPEMDKLADVPNRPLNNFEQIALPQLAAQQDIVVNQQPDRIQMLGALRAGKSCFECHHGDRGKLLGAFSYEFAPLTNQKDASIAKRTQNL